MIKEKITPGPFCTNTKEPSNNNFQYLFNNPAAKLQRFISKVKSYGVYKEDVIRVSIWADSIWNDYKSTIETLLETTFPEKTFEFVHAQLGGAGSDYQSAMVNEVINFNPDLIIIEEFEDFRNCEIAEYLIRLIKLKTSADIILNPFPMRGADMDLIVAKNMEGYKDTLSYHTSQWFYSIASRYDCAVVDGDQDVVPDLYNGKVTVSQLTTDGIHRLEYWFTNYLTPLFELFFKELIDNFYQHTGKVDWSKSISLWVDAALPDLSVVTKSGTWTINEISSSIYEQGTFRCLKSSIATDYIEVDFEGIGVAIAHYGDAVGEFGVLIDGVAPSTLLKDYATSAHNGLVGLYKIIVDTNILDNDETEREFTVTMNSATGYTLVDTTNSNTIGTGVITNDEVFSVTSGQITIPANYAEVNNWRGTIETGQVYTFSIKKNWYDTITISADNLTTTTRIFGLDRGDHTIRLTVNSGEVNIDSIMELK